MLGRRCRRWSSIEPTLGQVPVFDGYNDSLKDEDVILNPAHSQLHALRHDLSDALAEY